MWKKEPFSEIMRITCDILIKLANEPKLFQDPKFLKIKDSTAEIRLSFPLNQFENDWKLLSLISKLQFLTGLTCFLEIFVVRKIEFFTKGTLSSQLLNYWSEFHVDTGCGDIFTQENINNNRLKIEISIEIKLESKSK